MSEEDLSRMLDLVAKIPDHIEESWRKMKQSKMPALGKKGALIICGMGGSAMAGRMLRDLIRQEASVPIFLESSYSLPAFADKNTPVICISYSGDTEEVLECFQNALLRGCPTVAITAGGRLAREAEKYGVPAVVIQGGIPPRAALGLILTPLLYLVSTWRLYQVSDEDIESAARRARKLVEKNSISGDATASRSLQLAKRLYGKTPLIYSGHGLLASAAYRWKCQFNENSKSMAFANNFPELGHNEIMGWDSPERLRADYFLILLRDAEDHPRVQRGMEIMHKTLEPLASGAVLIDSEGDPGRSGRLARLLSIVLLGDFTSVYLAVEYGKDPTPIERIDRLKEELKMEVRGRDSISGLPRMIEVTSSEITQAIQLPLQMIIGVVKGVLEETPPELASDIIDKGIVLAGGTSLLRGIDKLLTQVTGVACHIAEDPLLCVVRGTGVALENLDVYKRSIARK